ncbi:MAG TPA: electron transport complex subunit RsxB [Chromatiaceae bacterium]|nr:electron transport complex subunit RsxB [Chromatiaceae bacterium]HIB84014.1 electron transport complex subunit RsxB [Chromatiaceae bacterium]HIN81996.1 electron transport complex subunit RsxB [Chromatiales bacterium]HIO14113.1 electron transport complex subunit RsxB [Chromatiales bacterium]HIO54262.1 electron transport complex subunit RsxB [Chromatiales bacterium]
MSVLLLTALALAFGVFLGFVAIKFRVEGDPIVEKIDTLLPQTQCGQCGYPGCRPYAEAIASEEAEINQCPPGGEAGVQALAELLGKEPMPLNPDNGVAEEGPAMLALIDEETCIGCTKCVQICPVDAISGAPGFMHTVLDVYCTGCELCLPPLCPVDDCIIMVPVEANIRTWKWSNPEAVGAVL